MGCCQSNSSSGFRFKDYVVAVYPEEIDGEANLDALGKLKAYVGKNPERIPKVCRKVSKLVMVDLHKGRPTRVLIGSSILHELIEDSQHGPGGGLDYFVPHTVDLVCRLHKEKNDPELRISACDLTAVLTHKIVDKPQYEGSRRSLASSQGELIQYLSAMAMEGIGTSDVTQLHCRYASLVALGNLFRCLRTSLVDSVDSITLCTLENYNAELESKQRADATSGGGGGGSRNRINIRLLDAGGSSAIEEQNLVLKAVALPLEAARKDAAYQTACLALLMALATACSNATTGHFVTSICTFMDANNCWGSEAMVLTTFKAITLALHRKQQLGFSVVQKLLDLVMEQRPDSPIIKLEGLLKAITYVLGVVPLNGVRPMLCMDALSMVLRSPTQEDAVYRAGVQTVEEVSRRTRLQGNVGQLLQIGLQLCHAVSQAQHSVSISVGLDSLTAAAPSLCRLPPVERNKLRLLSTLRVFLNANKKKDLVLKEKAVACMATYLLGGSGVSSTGPVGTGIAGAGTVVLDTTQFDDSTMSGVGAAGMMSPLVHTLPEELDFAHHWLEGTILSEEAIITPTLLMETSNVVLGMLRSGGYSVLPWALDVLLFDVQSALEKIESATSADPQEAGSQWTLLWHLFALTTLRSIGFALNMRELVDYSADIMKRRKSPDVGEVPSSFQPKFDANANVVPNNLRGGAVAPPMLSDSGTGAERRSAIPSVGLTVVPGHEDATFSNLLDSAGGSAPAVTFVISRRTVAKYILQQGNLQNLKGCYNAASEAEVLEGLLGNGVPHQHPRSASGESGSVAPSTTGVVKGSSSSLMPRVASSSSNIGSPTPLSVGDLTRGAVSLLVDGMPIASPVVAPQGGTTDGNSPSRPGDGSETSAIGGGVGSSSYYDLDVLGQASDLHFSDIQNFAEVEATAVPRVVFMKPAAGHDRRGSTTNSSGGGGSQHRDAFTELSLAAELQRRSQGEGTATGVNPTSKTIIPFKLPSPLFKRSAVEKADSVSTWATTNTCTTLSTPGLPRHLSVTTSRAKVMRMPGVDLSHTGMMLNSSISTCTGGGGGMTGGSPLATAGLEHVDQGSDNEALLNSVNYGSDLGGGTAVPPPVADFDLYQTV